MYAHAPPNSLSPAERAVVSRRLFEAEQAYHELLTGTLAVRVKDQNGEEVEYTAASAPRLEAYIKTLRDMLTPALRHNRPMRLLF